jgi:hypothetical protein
MPYPPQTAPHMPFAMIHKVERCYRSVMVLLISRRLSCIGNMHSYARTVNMARTLATVPTRVIGTMTWSPWPG